MEPEREKLLEETYELAKENNDMLRSIKRSMRLQRAMSMIYWIFIIGSAIGAYYLIQPYIDQAKSIYGNTQSTFDVFRNFGQ